MEFLSSDSIYDLFLSLADLQDVYSFSQSCKRISIIFKKHYQNIIKRIINKTIDRIVISKRTEWKKRKLCGRLRDLSTIYPQDELIKDIINISEFKNIIVLHFSDFITWIEF